MLHRMQELIHSGLESANNQSSGWIGNTHFVCHVERERNGIATEIALTTIIDNVVTTLATCDIETGTISYLNDFTLAHTFIKIMDLNCFTKNEVA